MAKKKERYYDLILYLSLSIFTICVGYYSFGKGFDFDTLMGAGGGDAVFGVSLIKSIQENGMLGIYFNPRIGAPDVSLLMDYPVIDVAMALVVWVISWFTKSSCKIMYIYYMITFAFDSVALAMLLRKLKIKRAISFVVGAIFAFVPFHFLRGIGHSTLINYMYFAIVIYLSLCIIEYFENEKKWKIILLAFLLGLGYGYYYAFGLIIMAVAVIIRFCRDFDVKKLKTYIWIPIITFCTVVITLLPKAIYGLINGANELVGVRKPIEQEIYGLKIIQLLFPPKYTRVQALSDLYTEYASQAPLVNENDTATLGLVAGTGFILLCIALIYSFVAKNKCRTKEWQFVDFLSLSTLTLVLFATIGGIGEIFNWFVTSQIRCYNRSSIYIAGLALVMVAFLLNKIEFKYYWLSWMTCIVLLGVSMYDTVYVKEDNWQEGVKPVQECYEDFFSRVEETLDENAMVYQLPYLGFPEEDENLDYKHFIGYLYTDTLRWSYGGIKGRNESAKKLYVDDGKSYTFLKNIKEAGFDAIYIDLSMYEDGGTSILQFYNNLGIQPLVSSDGQLYLYDIKNMESPQDELCQVGAAFVNNLNNEYSLGWTLEEVGQIAKGLNERNAECLQKVCDSVVNIDFVKNYSDEEYVDFLYNRMLGRVESRDEQEQWLEQIKNGVSRQDVCNSFLICDEFRSIQELDME